MPNPHRLDGTPDLDLGPAARRFRPRLLPTLATVVAVALFVSAGNWQRDRMHGKQALRARYDAAAELPQAVLSEVKAEVSGDWAAARFRRVVVRGQYDAAHQILVDNKVYAGRAGYHVVTPLRLADGDVVLVDRGWTAAGPTRAVLPEATPPAGGIEVEGRLNLPPARYLELAADAAAGAVWQNLDTARFAKATGIAVLPAIVEQTVPPEPADALVRDWPEPDFGIDQHRIYMVQWYAFAALALGLWIGLNLRKGKAGKT